MSAAAAPSKIQDQLANFSERVKSAGTFLTFSISMALKVKGEIDGVVHICAETQKLALKSKELAKEIRKGEGGAGVFLDPDCSIGNSLRETGASFSAFIPKLLHARKSYEPESTISRVHLARITRQSDELINAMSEFVVNMDDLHMAVIEHDAKGVDSSDYKEAPPGESYEIQLETLDASFTE
jgi:hypothetical protein